MSFEVEIIPDNAFVYRQILPHEWIGLKKRRFPSESHFELRPDEEGLSVNWDKYITVENNYILIALTKNSKDKFQNHTAYKIFRYPTELFRNIEGIEDLIHKPVFNGNPAPIGKPNNQSHSEAIYVNDPEILLKLSDYCNVEHETSFCKFNVNSINDRVKELKAMLNDTPFHKL